MSLTDEEFRTKLEKHFSLYRINLRSPLVSPIIPNHWYRVDLLLVNELGLFRRADIEPDGQVIVTCDLFTPNHKESITPFQTQDRDWEIEIRSCHAFSEGRLSKERMPVPGFVQSGKGAFEYRVRSKHHSKQGQQKRFIHIKASKLVQFPKGDKTTHNEDMILPLVVGPIEIISDTTTSSDFDKEEKSSITNLPLELWDPNEIKDMIHDGYRVFSVATSSSSCDPPLNNIAIHEMWDSGIPGKIWDSALVMLDFIKNMIKLRPDYIQGKHTLDLSAGTGLLGFYVAASMIESSSKQGQITITELGDAVDLINKNGKINNFLLLSNQQLQTKSLLWGNRKEAEACGKADLILASDVLYESQFFEDLVKTFVDLSTSETRIYIGYKRRGFDEAEEQRFWSLCSHYFDVKLLDYEDKKDEDHILVPQLILKETNVQLYRLLPRTKLSSLSPF
ncbi:putative methyltransferase-domain-containing protein [Cokeromyces recurvatus]|uniref:putative methyltransferase-domain-containing protein n=1 Tax=Cokeromyces recurvatus TaxID=90255 RepID=UPI00221F8BD3|nr:putative methyltransferase-domain-containing protein [Cokeromyces recurvatus]KAI7899806.1 putative methyltransferase-domain-containing protein [Cokeromyces recurvatus]